MTHMKTPLFWRLMCAIGILHGPRWYGNESSHRSDRFEGFARRCNDCGAVWHGEQCYREHPPIRYLGNWRRVR